MTKNSMFIDTDAINTNCCRHCIHGKPNKVFKDSDKHWDIYCRILKVTKHPESNCMKLKLR